MTEASKLIISGREYPLGTVTLDVYDRAEADVELIMILSTGTDDDLASPFFSDQPVSSAFRLELPVEGIYTIDGINNLKMDFRAKKPHNEDPLGGSIICEPGQCLRIHDLHIEFGLVDSDRISVQFTAQCTGFGVNSPELRIAVTASVLAEIRIRRPYADVAEDLRRYYHEHEISQD